MSIRTRIVAAKRLVCLFALLTSLLAHPLARASTGWSSQDYDLYAGDFDGDGATDILYIAKDPSNPSGIAHTDATGAPNTPWQSWPSSYLGIAWYANLYTVVVADFNGDGKADILLQRNSAGDSYLLLANAQGKITAISQTINNSTAGVMWSADQHHIVAGDFNGDGKADVLLQATSPSGLNAVILADSNGQFTAGSPAQSWNDGYLGFNWATTEANVFAGNFNGTGGVDLLIQAKPKFVMIDFDVSFPVPTYPPNMNGFIPSQGASLFTTTGIQRWGRMAFGVDWATLSANVVVGTFNLSACGTCSDVILQGRTGGKPSYLLTANSSGAIFSTGTTLAANVTWTADSYRLIAGNFAGRNLSAGIYFQSTSASGTDYVADSVTGSSVSPIAHNPSNPTGVVPASAVGKTTGSFAVTGDGIATYSVPITVPPGANGMQPKLSIDYHSGGGNGPLGIGWGIGGLSEISRCRKTYIEDGSNAAVQMTAGDALCLDGNKLRLTAGTYGAAGSVYQTQMEQFNRVTAFGTAGNGPAYFVVEGKNGLQYEYGNTSDSRILSLNPNASTTARTWALDKVTDASGNSLSIIYQDDGSPSGSYRPLEIDYTSNSAAGLAAAYKVKFFWDARSSSDSPSGYIGGGLVRDGYRLNHIETQYNDAQVGSFRLVRRYQLGYNNSGVTGQSRLASIQECDRNANCLAPTMISWQEGVSGWASTDTVSSSDAAAQMYYSYAIDIDGDGRTDLVYPQINSGTYTWVYMHANTSGGFDPPVPTGISAGDSTSLQFSQALPIDYFGNGRIELLAAIPGHSTLQLLGWNGSTLALTNTNISQPSSGSQWVADFNADGHVDFIYATSSGTTATLHVQLNTGYNSSTSTATFGSATSVATVSAVGNILNPVLGGQSTALGRPMDFNGDGRGDLVYFISNTTCDPVSFQCTVNTTTGVLLSTGSTFTSGGIFYCTGIDTLCPNPIAADFNGDGITDLLLAAGGQDGNNAYQIAYGTGAGVSIVGSATIPNNAFFSGATVADLDGDGRDDVLYWANGDTVFSWLRFNGTDFDAPIPTTVPVVDGTQRLLDLDGDGQIDIGYQSSQYRVRKHNGAFPDLVSSITDGYGNTTTISYAPMTDSSVYQKGSSALFPMMDFESSQYVVKQYSATDGIGGTYSVSENYSGALVHLQGRGFEGFAQKVETDSRTGIVTTQLFNQSFPFTGTVSQETVKQSNGNTIQQTVSTYQDLVTSSTLYSDRHYVYPGTVAQTTYEVATGNGALDGSPIRKVTTVTTPDAYGNPTSITNTTADLSGSGLSYVTQTTNTATNDTSNWCLGFVTTQQVQNTMPGLAAQTRTIQFVRDTTNLRACRPQQKIVEPNLSALSVTTTYQYDGFGHPSSQKVSGTGIADRTSTMNYGSLGIFPLTVTNAANEYATKTYDYALGVPLTGTDANGVSVSWQYDGFGRKTQESRLDGTKTSWTLYACTIGNSYCGDSLLRYEIVMQQLDAHSGVIRTESQLYDALERARYVQSESLSGATSVVQSNFDSLGRISSRSNPYFAGGTAYFTAYTYDVIGRALTQQGPLNEADAIGSFPYCSVCRTFHYGYSKLTETVTDPNSHTTSRTKNAIGQVAQVVDALSGTTSYTYDQFGNVLTTKDPSLNVVTSTYNIRGFKLTTADPDMGTWTYDYYPTGEVKTQTDAKSQITTYTYDGVSRLVTRAEAEGTTIFNYGTSSSAHNIGKLASITAPGISQTFTFDSIGREDSTTTTFDSQSFVISNGYDTNTGLLTTVTYPTSTTAVPNSRFKVQYDYANGLLADIRDFNSPSTVYWQNVATDPAGRTIDEAYGNSLHTYSTYDLSTGLLHTRFTGNSNQIQNLTYQWDPVGNLKERKDASLNLTEDFTYDELNRLHQSTLNSSVNLTMGYDAIGNIVSKTGVGSYDYTTQQSGCTYTGLTAQPHAVRNAGGNVYCYDANGNAIKRAGSTIGWTSYNMPYSLNQGSSSAQFFYDGQRARYKQVAITASGGSLPSGTETTRYVGSFFEQITKPSGVVEYKHYIRAGSDTVAIRTLRSSGTNDTRYLHRDHLGSVDTITDETGAIVLKESFDAFGMRRNPSTWSGTPTAGNWTSIAALTHRGFTGHEMLDNIGLIHMNGRVFDPTIGRFLSADPNLQAPQSSQALNRYAYVMNNPLSYTDPSGYFLSGFFHSLFRFMNAFTRYMIFPTVGHFFEMIRAQPGQHSVDNFVMTHKWAYALGDTIATVATAWGYGFGGAIWSAYYTYTATGSEWAAVRTGAIIFAENYVMAKFSAGSAERAHDVGPIFTATMDDDGAIYLTPGIAPGTKVLFINGMLNDQDMAMINAFLQTGQSQVAVVYNPTNGFLPDLAESIAMKLTGSSSLGNEVAEAISGTPGITTIVAHSQGTLIVANAMKVLEDQGFQFAPGTTIEYFGGAANNMVSESLASKLGAHLLYAIHPYDMVGNVVGMNTLSPIKFIGSILAAPTLFMGSNISPHSIYTQSELPGQ